MADYLSSFINCASKDEARATASRLSSINGRMTIIVSNDGTATLNVLHPSKLHASQVEFNPTGYRERIDL